MPLYYDYSEAFEEHCHLNNSNISVLSLAEHVELENRPPGESPELKTVELDLDNAQLEDGKRSFSKSPNRSPRVVKSPSPVTAPHKFLKQMSEWEKEHENPSSKEIDARRGRRDSIESLDHKMEAPQKQIAEEPAVNDIVGHHILSSSRAQTRDRIIKGSHHTISEMSISEKSTIPKIFGEGVLDTRQSFNVAQDTPHSGCSSTVGKEGHMSNAEWKIPSLNFGPLKLDTQDRGIMGFQSNQKEPSTLSLEGERPGIQAPVPKRSTSSRTDRERFSRILSIDEGFAELARAVLDSGLQSGTALNASLDTNSRYKSLLHRDSTEITTTDFSPAVSVSAWNSVDIQDTGSSTQQHQYESQKKRTISPTHSSCDSTPNPTVNGLPQVGTTAYPEDSGTESMSTAPRKASKAEKSTNVDVGWPEPGSERPSEIHPKHGVSPEEPRNASAPRIYHSAVRHSSLPHSTPALAESKAETATMALLEAASIVPWEYDEPNKDEAYPIKKHRLCMQSEGVSPGLPLSPRPSDVTGNNPGTALSENRGPSFHDPLSKPKSSKAKAPKFKLKITRASSSTSGTVRVTLSPTSSPRHSFGTPFDLFQGGPSRRRSKTENTSNENPALVDLEAQPQPENEEDDITTQATGISVRPPSPALHFADVQSFFSDDSSNVEQKGSLRQRLSQLKVIASRGNSTDELRNFDRRQTGSGIGRPRGHRADSARHMKRSSVQSDRTTSSARQTRWKIGWRLKSWWHRGENKLKGLGKKMKKGRKKRSVSSDLYVGV